MHRSDRFAALFFIVLSLIICQQSLVIGVGTLGRPGPGLLSFGAGAAIGLLALVFLIGTFLKGTAGSERSDEAARGTHAGIVVAVSISLFIYAIAVNWLGFVLATPLFVLFLFRTVETESWWRSVMKAVLVTLGNYIVFVVWLGVRLPKGLLPW